MTLAAWKQKNKVSNEAFSELCSMLFNTWPLQAGTAPSGKSEAYVESLVKLEAPKFGVNLMRNNVGQLLDDNGRPVRYGLMNSSKQVNTIFKSSDEVGFRSFVITPDMVGAVVAQFVAREIKKADWTFSGDTHEQAQLNFINLINHYGGDACFATGEGSFSPLPKLKRNSDL